MKFDENRFNGWSSALGKKLQKTHNVSVSMATILIFEKKEDTTAHLHLLFIILVNFYQKQSTHK